MAYDEGTDGSNIVYRGTEGSGAAQIFDRVNMRPQETAINLADEQRKEEDANKEKEKLKKEKELNDAYAGLANVGAGSWYKHSQYFDEAVHDLTNMAASDPSILDPVRNPQGYINFMGYKNKIQTHAKYSAQIQKDVEGIRDEIAKDPKAYEPEDIINLSKFADKPFKEIVANGETVPLVRKKPDHSKWQKAMTDAGLPTSLGEVEKDGHIKTDKSINKKELNANAEDFLNSPYGADAIAYYKGDREAAKQHYINVQKAKFDAIHKDVLSDVGKDDAKSAKDGEWHLQQMNNLMNADPQSTETTRDGGLEVMGGTVAPQGEPIVWDKQGYLSGQKIGVIEAGQTQQIDPKTKKPLLDSEGNPVMGPITDVNGKVLNKDEVVQAFGYNQATKQFMVRTNAGNEVRVTDPLKALQGILPEAQFNKVYQYFKKQGAIDSNGHFIGTGATKPSDSPKKVTYRVNGEDYEIPENKASAFLKKYPQAKKF